MDIWYTIAVVVAIGKVAAPIFGRGSVLLCVSRLAGYGGCMGEIGEVSASCHGA